MKKAYISNGIYFIGIILPILIAIGFLIGTWQSIIFSNICLCIALPMLFITSLDNFLFDENVIREEEIKKLLNRNDYNSEQKIEVLKHDFNIKEV